MKRREFFGVLSGAGFLWSASAFAEQPGKIHRIGVLWHGANAEAEAIYLAALRQGLHDFGYVEGQNIVLEMRFPAEQYERFFVLAAELVQQKPDAESIPEFFYPLAHTHLGDSSNMLAAVDGRRRTSNVS